MIKKSTVCVVLDFFFENPTTEYYLRELSRLLKLSMPTILSSTDALAKEGFIIKKKGKVTTLINANLDNTKFIQRKRVFNLEKVHTSEIVEYLSKLYNHPKIIVLFGSFSRGEDTENSDIDIAIITNKKLSLNLEKYEKLLKRRISIHEIDLNKISKEFNANLSNGIVLGGSW